MRTIGSILLLLALPLSTVGGQTPDPAAEVRAAETAFAQTMADRNLDAFMEFVATDAVFFTGPTPRRGREAVRTWWARYFEGAEAPFSWRPEVVEVLPSGGLALSSGPVTAADGSHAGRYMSIWRRDPDGRWRVVFDRGE